MSKLSELIGMAVLFVLMLAAGLFVMALNCTAYGACE